MFTPTKSDNYRAIKDYSEAIRLDPKNLRAYSGRGDVYRGKSDFERAARDYGKAIELVGKPEKAHWTYWLFRGVSYERLGKWPQAEADFLKAMELSRSAPRFSINSAITGSSGIQAKEGLAPP